MEESSFLKIELRSAIGAQRPNFCNGRTDKKNLEPKHLLMCFEALSWVLSFLSNLNILQARRLDQIVDVKNPKSLLEKDIHLFHCLSL